MLDTGSLSVLYTTDCVSSPTSPIISLAMRTFPDTRENSLKNSESGTVAESAKEVAFVLTNDAHMVLIDSISGKTISSQSIHTKEESTAICMYLLGKYLSLMIQTNFCAQMFTVFVDLFASRRRRSSP